MNKIWDGLIFGIGATIAFHLIGFLLSAGMYLAFILISMLTGPSGMSM